MSDVKTLKTLMIPILVYVIKYIQMKDNHIKAP